MPHWLRRLLPFLTFLTIRSKYRNRVSLIKIEAAKTYVLGVKKTRFFLLGVLFVVFSLVLFASGLSLIHAGLFVYSGWSVQVKFFAALITGAVEIVVAVGILYYLFLEETWVKFSGIKDMLKSIAKKDAQASSS